MTTKSPLETVIEDIIEEKLAKLTESDIKKLVREAMPNIDQMIANKIKEHFYQIGNFLVEKFKEPGE
jgi:hypothetical protein